MTNLVQRLFGSIVRGTLRHRALAAAGALGVLLFFAFATLRLRLDPSFDILFSERSEVSLALDTLRTKFGDDLEFVLAVEGDVFSPDYLQRLHALHLALEAAEVRLSSEADPRTFERVVSLLNAPIVRGHEGSIEVDVELRDPPTQDRLEHFRPGGAAKEPLVGRNGRASLVIVQLGAVDDGDLAKLYTALLDVVKEHSGPEFAIGIAGYPALTAELSRLLVSDTSRLLGVAIAVAFTVLILIFRRPIGIVGPMLVCAVGSFVTYGTMALSDVPLTLITLYLPAFLICVGLADAIHVQTSYRQLRWQGLTRQDAIVTAFEETAVPVFLTTVTTCLGLLSLNTAKMIAVRELGTFAALGIATSLAATLVILPLILSIDTKLGDPRLRPKGPDWLDRVLLVLRGGSSTSRVARTWPLWVLGLFVVASAVAVTQLTVHHDPLNWFPRRHPLKSAMQSVDEHFAGSTTITFLIEPSPGVSLRDPAFLDRLEAFATSVSEYRNPADGSAFVGHVSSLIEPVHEAWRSLDPNSSSSRPATKEEVDGVFTMLELMASERLKQFITIDGSTTQMKVHARWADAGTYTKFLDHIRSSIRKHLGDSAKVSMTGSALQMHTVADRLLEDLIESFGVALVTITLVMATLFGSLRLAALSMIPNLIPIAAVLGLMGAIGIPLDIHTVLVVSIALGIVVDDTIHLIHQFRMGLHATGTAPSAVEYAFARAGRAIVSTTWTLVAGFSVYFAAELRHLQQIGLLIGFALIIALLCDLTLTPALLARYGAGRSREAMPAPAPTAMG